MLLELHKFQKAILLCHNIDVANTEIFIIVL